MNSPLAVPSSSAPSTVVTRQLRIGIVADWPRVQRHSYWREVIEKDVQERNCTCKFLVHEYRLAERMNGPASKSDPRPMTDPSESKVEVDLFLQNCDVLIINWDAVNGDPVFGSDSAYRWFEHRRPEVYNWVAKGGILIIEGQVAMNIPLQEAYDGVLGEGELRVCNAVNKLHPLRQVARCGKKCRFTGDARQSALLEGLANPESMVQREYNDMFVNNARQAVSPCLRDYDWAMLYRGWFRRRPLTSMFALTSFRWVPLLVTGDRWPRHSTMVVAQHGDGAIFATTMMLASSRQIALIDALLSTHGKTHRLPPPSRWRRRVATFVRVQIGQAIVLTAVTSKWTIIDATKNSWLRVAALLASVVAFWLVIGILRWSWRGLRALLGY